MAWGYMLNHHSSSDDFIPDDGEPVGLWAAAAAAAGRATRARLICLCCRCYVVLFRDTFVPQVYPQKLLEDHLRFFSAYLHPRSDYLRCHTVYM